MAYNILYWLGSGENHEIYYKSVISTDALGITEKEWDDMSEGEQAYTIQELAFDLVGWGFEKL